MQYIYIILLYNIWNMNQIMKKQLRFNLIIFYIESIVLNLVTRSQDFIVSRQKKKMMCNAKLQLIQLLHVQFLVIVIT